MHFCPCHHFTVSQLFNRSIHQRAYDQKPHLRAIPGRGKESDLFIRFLPSSSLLLVNVYLIGNDFSPSSELCHLAPWRPLRKLIIYLQPGILSQCARGRNLREDEAQHVCRGRRSASGTGQEPQRCCQQWQCLRDAFRKKEVVKRIGKPHNLCPIHTVTYLGGLLS